MIFYKSRIIINENLTYNKRDLKTIRLKKAKGWILRKNDKIRQINKIATKGCESGKTENRKRQKMAQTKYKNKLQCKKHKLIMLAAKA